MGKLLKCAKACVASLLVATTISACTSAVNNDQQANTAQTPANSTLNQQSPKQNQKQNIVMIIVDDLRPVLGVYGDKNAYTPNIDALAVQGITFNQAYANVPVCGASRASMLTGIRPNKTRFIDYKAKAEKDAPGAKSLPQVLRESGYHTMGIGKIFHNSKDLAKVSWSEKLQNAGMGHATRLNPDSENYLKTTKFNKRGNGPWYETMDVADEAYPDGKVKEKALKALTRLAKQEQPFFLSVGFIRPHLPFYAPKKYYDLHPREKFSPFFDRNKPRNAPKSLNGSGEIHTYHFKDYTYNSDAFHVSSLQGYYASVSYIDALVGDVIAQIDSLGLRDNTTIMLISDHGFNLGEHNFWTKHTMLETSLRIPMIVAGPNIAQNEKTDALVELVDVFPTITEITQVNPPATVQGQSFVKSLQNASVNHKKQIYSRFKKGDSVVNDDYIFTSYTTADNTIEEMLYDHKVDPHETNNVVNEASYQAVATKMRAQLTACITQQQCQTH